MVQRQAIIFVEKMQPDFAAHCHAFEQVQCVVQDGRAEIREDLAALTAYATLTASSHAELVRMQATTTEKDFETLVEIAVRGRDVRP